MANWCGSAYVYNVFGLNQYGEQFGTMLVDSHLGGGGARFIGDGYDTSGTLSVPRPSVANIESLEGLYPLLYLYRRRTSDSGGPGRYRGGVSAETAMTVYGVDGLSVTVSTLGSDHSSAVGASGGYPGGSATAILIRQSNALALLSAGRLSQDPMEWGGDYDLLPPKEKMHLGAGDVFISVPHGGGGYEDPLLRAPDAVSRDVLEGRVSIGEAERIYGTILHPETFLPIDTETRRRRVETRRRRLDALSSVSPPVEKRGEAFDPEAPHVRANKGLLVQAGFVFCPHCLKAIASTQEFGGCPEIVVELGDAGPWVSRLKGGKSTNFMLVESICPVCGALVDVTQRRRNSSDQQENASPYGEVSHT
jgi:hypothetical protein